MEKSKLKINKLGKIGTMIPALLAAGMLNCAAATFHNTPNSKATSLGNKTLVYQTAAPKYSEKKSIETMTNILNSDLNQMTGYDRLEAKVQDEIINHLADMNANSLELARLYKALEDHTVANSSLTPQEMNSIAVNNGVGTSDQVNVQVVRSAIQHFMHMVLDTSTLIRFRADAAEIITMDEGDGKNEYLQFNTKGERDLRKEINAVLSAAETDLLNYTQYEYAVKGQDGKQFANKISGNLRKIKSLVTQANLKPAHYQSLLTLINETADLLPASMYGTQAMRRGLIVEFASNYSMNHLLTVMANLGYDINNLNTGNLVKQKKDVTLSPSTTFYATNKHAGLGIGLTTTTPLGKNWDVSYGGEIVGNKGYNGGNDSIQLLATGAAGKTFDNGNHASIGAKAGVQFDNKGASTPFGINGGYTWNINNEFSLDFGVSSLLNVQRSLADIGATIGASYRTKSLVLKFGVNLGYTFDWNKETSTQSTTPDKPVQPDKPDQPTYGEDEIIKVDPDKTVDMGNIHDLPEKPVDLNLY